MSDFMDLCLRRQTCREFADRPVEHDKPVQCVEAARNAPSGCNAQPWSFVVVESPDTVKQVGECVQ
ncbi:MAG: nitroreductase family protein [Planctomycetaceae bacterium]|nr:nitroreductase family protein [Planctomycetaceae bacterium]